jgi:2,3-bisphosphoglycerate-independent phosphoglycerate mutase
MHSAKVALIILDGWGINHDPKVSAIEAASTPFFDHLIQSFPNNVLTTFGEEVGLPEGQMGNSEVGHMNIGAGRIVYQELVRINKAFKEKTIENNPAFLNTLEFAGKNTKRIHLMGLLSDGGVHSHIDHVSGLCEILKHHQDLEIFIHAFLDGRDTDPQSGKKYVLQLENQIENSNIRLASVIGRYYAMDRDKRWERTQKAFDLLASGKGSVVHSFTESLQEYYSKKITDEFMEPLIHEHFHDKKMFIQENDVILFFNFRTDRPRQLTEVLTQTDMHEFNMHTIPVYMVTFTEYDNTFKNIHVIFEKDNLDQTLGQILSENGKNQLRIAETEKYPHVTFFFNGGRETPYPGEDRIMIPSPKVATYDLKPEMSASEITERLIQYTRTNLPDFICLNYANTDMVGHTGDFMAAVKATETVDECLSRLVPFLSDNDYSLIIIADHGNSDVMINEDGTPNTAHTTNPVPVIVITNTNISQVSSGKLGDIAPTILHFFNIEKPEIMTGQVLTD